MNWAVFTERSTLQIQVHWLLAIVALLVGVVILLSAKGTRRHVWLGRLWVGAMVLISLSALFIRGGDGMPRAFGFSPIHLLVPFTLIMLVRGLGAIRQNDVRRHKITMVATFFGALVVAGAFTFLPGRHMHSLFFSAADPVERQTHAETRP